MFGPKWLCLGDRHLARIARLNGIPAKFQHIGTITSVAARAVVIQVAGNGSFMSAPEGLAFAPIESSFVIWGSSFRGSGDPAKCQQRRSFVAGPSPDESLYASVVTALGLRIDCAYKGQLKMTCPDKSCWALV